MGEVLDDEDIRNFQPSSKSSEKTIYLIRNLVNQKGYVGQTKDLRSRVKSHKKGRERNKIGAAIHKYGWHNFSVEVLERNVTNYNERERFWIEELNTLVPFGYNVHTGGVWESGVNGITTVIETEDDFQEICRLLKDTDIPIQDIAKRFHCDPRTISNINHGVRYHDDAREYPIRTCDFIDRAQEVVNDLQTTSLSMVKIGQRWNMDQHEVSSLNAGKYHRFPGVTYPIRPVEQATRKYARLLSEQDLMCIYDLLENTNLSQREIGKRFGVHRSIITNINNGTVKTYFDPSRSYPVRVTTKKKGGFSYADLERSLDDNIKSNLEADL